MTHRIDDSLAWRLVLALSPARAESSDPVTAALPAGGHDHPPARVRVDPAGRWEAAFPVTSAARDIFDLFLPLRVRPGWSLGQLGQSLDGRIATESGDSHYVTGEEDRTRLHRLRALADAVVVGAGTVAADDPRLTVRAIEGENPYRVVLDPDGRLGTGHRVFQDGAAPTILVRRAPAGETLPPWHGRAEVQPVPGPSPFDPRSLLEGLAARGLPRVLVEGGGVTVSAFLRAGALDRLHVTVAPLMIGPGRPGLLLDPIERLDRALRPSCRHFRLGDDILFDFDLRTEA